MGSISLTRGISIGRRRFITIDDRANYGELRELALGFIGVRLYAMAFTRRDRNIRIISLRKANRIEVRHYVEAIDG